MLANVVDRADVRMIQCGGRAGLPPKTFQRLGSCATSSGRNFSATTRPSSVLGLINHTHPPAPKLFQDAIVRDSATDDRRRIRHSGAFYASAATQAIASLPATTTVQNPFVAPTIVSGTTPTPEPPEIKNPTTPRQPHPVPEFFADIKTNYRR